MRLAVAGQQFGDASTSAWICIVVRVASALVLGGTGQIGHAVSSRFAADGWDVTVAARNPPADGATRFVQLDRSQRGMLGAVAPGFDVLVDIVPFTVADAKEVAALAGTIGSVISISSAAVYGFGGASNPRPIPIPESFPTVEPSGEGGYAEQKRAIEIVLEESDLPTTSIRAGAVYGPHTAHSREWYFVKRVLDDRSVIVLARRGEGRFHTVSVDNMAELIVLAAGNPGNRILNAGDPNPPTVLQIARAIADTMGHQWSERLLPGAEQGNLGDHPWNTETPFVLDMSTAERELGYRQVATYAESVGDTVEWLVHAVRHRRWQDVLTRSPYLETMFDYAAEDEYVRRALSETP